MDVLVYDESEDDDDDCGDSSFFSISTNSDDDTIITSNILRKNIKNRYFQKKVLQMILAVLNTNIRFYVASLKVILV